MTTIHSTRFIIGLAAFIACYVAGWLLAGPNAAPPLFTCALGYTVGALINRET
jgi:hypothetical protein